MKRFIPMAQPHLSNLELQLATSAIKSSWISSTGKFIEEFEKVFAKCIGTRYAISTSNGTTALHLALLSLGIGAGDEVIIPNLTFIATANVVAYTGAKAVLVDVDPYSWNIDPTKVAQKITKKTRAVIPVHLYGYPAKINLIRKLLGSSKIAIVEDAAEAHGAQIGKKVVGSLGNIGCFSFYGNKIITTGEGGMLTTNNRRLAERVHLFKNHGMSSKKKYWHPVVGYNYRLTNIQAAIGYAQMTQFKRFLKKREQIARWYREDLKNIESIVLPPSNTKELKGVNWLFTVLFRGNLKKTRNGLMSYLKSQGIDSRPIFFPISRFPMYKTSERFPVTEYLSSAGVTLPTHLSLTRENISYITSRIVRYIEL